MEDRGQGASFSYVFFVIFYSWTLSYFVPYYQAVTGIIRNEVMDMY